MTPEEYIAFFLMYREKRHKDLIETEVLLVKRRKGSKKSSKAKIGVSLEQLQLLKEVGLL